MSFSRFLSSSSASSRPAVTLTVTVVAAAAAAAAAAVLFLRRSAKAASGAAPGSPPPGGAPPPVVLPLRDVTPLSAPQLYTHGSWMGVGPQLLADAAWRRELAARTPLAAARAEAAAASGGSAAPGRLAAALENSPVAAAFGTAATRAAPRAREGSIAHNAVVLEWDVHLEPGALAAACAATAPGARGGAAARAAAARALARSLVVAHGSPLATAGERLLGLSAWAAVHSHSGGMTAPAWAAAYARALHARAPGLLPYAGAAPAPLVSVFLDVKTARAPARALGLLVEGLNERGVHVWGVGSFLHAQVDDAAAFPGAQRVALRPPPLSGREEDEEGGEEGGERGGDAEGGAAAPASPAAVVLAPPPRRIFLVTQPGEIQALAREGGSIPRGADVLFNGGTLLRPAAGGAWEGDARVVDGLAALAAARGLRIGFYAQEAAMDAGAADALARLVNARGDAFALGWNAGLLPGAAPAGAPPGAGVGAVPLWLAPLVWWYSREWR